MKKLILLLVALPLVSVAQTITTIAGTGTAGYTGDGVAATATGLYNPYDIGIDSVGNIFIGDALNQRIRKINTSGIISTVAGTGVAGYNGDGIIATTAKLNFPYGMAVNRAGTIVIADMSNQRIRSIQSETGGTISTIGGTGVLGYSGDGGAATAAKINNPQGIFWDPSNNVFFGDHDNNRLRKIDPAGTITTIAGNGTAGYSGDGGPATAASLYAPSSVAADATGNIYIADMFNHRIRRVDYVTGIITTVAGTGVLGYSGDGGPATAARIRYPKGVCVDRLGNILFTDTDNNLVRKINTTTGIITSIAGTGVAGFGGDGGPATLAKLNYPQGIYVDIYGNIYIGDCLNNRVRKIDCVPPVVAPISGVDTVCIGSSATLTCSTPGGIWSRSNTTASVGSATGVVTGSTMGMDTIIYTVTNSCISTAVSHPVYVKACGPLPVNDQVTGTRPQIYPNPVTDAVTIVCPAKGAHILISDVSGKVVYNATADDINVHIGTSHFAKGVYFVKINGEAAGKFVKQ